MLTNEYIAEVVANFVRNAGPNHYLIREVTKDVDRFFLSEYADHDPATGHTVWALKTVEGHMVINGSRNPRGNISCPGDFDEEEYLKSLSDA